MRRGCHGFITGKGPEKEENREIALSRIIPPLTEKGSGNLLA
jgi:hypothetical protein